MGVLVGSDLHGIVLPLGRNLELARWVACGGDGGDGEKEQGGDGFRVHEKTRGGQRLFAAAIFSIWLRGVFFSLFLGSGATKVFNIETRNRHGAKPG